MVIFRGVLDALGAPSNLVCGRFFTSGFFVGLPVLGEGVIFPPGLPRAGAGVNSHTFLEAPRRGVAAEAL